MHLGMGGVTNHFRLTVTLTSDLVLIIIVSGAYLIFFEIGIPILVCECNLGWWSFLYHLLVTMTLTSDLVCRIIMSRTSLILFEMGIPNLLYGYIFGC